MVTGMSDDLLNLAELLDSWYRALRRENKSEQTLRSYRRGVETFLAFCDDTGAPRELTKPNVLAWLDAQHGRGTASIRLRLTAVKLFARWLVDRGTLRR